MSYQQNSSRLRRLPDFFGITDSSGLIPLSRIWDNGIINNGRCGEELEKAKEHAERTQPEKKPSIRERLAAAKQECAKRQPRPATEKKPPELGER